MTERSTTPTKAATDEVREAGGSTDTTKMRDHWKCLAACTLVSMCPFQYGLDFGLIGGLQAMVGFLQVSGRCCGRCCCCRHRRALTQ